MFLITVARHVSPVQSRIEALETNDLLGALAVPSPEPSLFLKLACVAYSWALWLWNLWEKLRW